METPYTSGLWHVKPGRGEEFVAAWREFAEWSYQNAQGARWPTLLKDVDDDNRFVSFGAWDSLKAIEAWRALPGWGEHVGKIRELLVGFEAHTLESVVEFESR